MWAAAAIRLHPILEVLAPFGPKALVVRVLVLILSAAAILRSRDERRQGAVVAADAAVFLSGCALCLLFSPVLFAD